MHKQAKDLQHGDVIRLGVKINGSDLRIVDRVIPTKYRGIVGNNPIVCVWYQMHNADGCHTGNSWAHCDMVEVLDVAERVAYVESQMLAAAIAAGELS